MPQANAAEVSKACGRGSAPGSVHLVVIVRPPPRLPPLLLPPTSRRQIREALGIRRTVVSGGGSLAAHLDDFYEAIGLPVLNGWGLTETSPVLACRRQDRVGPGLGQQGGKDCQRP